MAELTQDKLKRLFNYNPETGDFTRLVRTANSVKVGDIAGSTTKRGYVVIKIYNKAYKAHRLAFLYMEGKFPEKGLEVDHINHVKDDNKWVNLRIVTHTENLKNYPRYNNNTSGYTGVSFDKSKDKWCSRIYIECKETNLGCFDNLEDAIAARKAAEIKYNYHPNHGKQINQN